MVLAREKTSLFGEIVVLICFFFCFLRAVKQDAKKKRECECALMCAPMLVVVFLLEFAWISFMDFYDVLKIVSFAHFSLSVCIFNSMVSNILKIWLQCYEWKTHINDDLTVVDSTNEEKNYVLWAHFKRVKPTQQNTIYMPKMVQFLQLIHEMIGKNPSNIMFCCCYFVWAASFDSNHHTQISI